MAGHSQFKNIMHRKGAQDAKRAKVFTKMIRELTTAARPARPIRPPTRVCAPPSGRARSEHAAATPSNGRSSAAPAARATAITRRCATRVWPGFGGDHRRGADRQPQSHGLAKSAPPSPSMAAPWARPIRSASCSTGSARSVTRPRRPVSTRCSKRRWRPVPTMSVWSSRRSTDRLRAPTGSARCARPRSEVRARRPAPGSTRRPAGAAPVGRRAGRAVAVQAARDARRQ